MRTTSWSRLALGSALVLALIWGVIVRVPLILNAADHLDSDLAVDGIALREAVDGHWRWHYPGTPSIGSIPVLLSWPQARAWGVSPITLVSGGMVAHGLLMIAVFLVAMRGFGPGVAAWSLISLTFSSTGAIWLSGRITGGHLLAAVWHAGAFALLVEALTRGGKLSAAVLGLWCGLGLYLDAMFVVTLAGLVPAAIWRWWREGRSRSGLACAAVFVTALLIGVAPREVGRKLDPHDAYQGQFQPVLAPELIEHHARILFLDCLPRLIVGHRLPALQADPDPRGLAGPGPSSPRPDDHPLAYLVTGLGLVLFIASFLALLLTPTPPAGRAVRLGLAGSTLAVIVAFLINRDIYNSDNYRYIVTVLVPWSVGFGLVLDTMARRGRGGRVASVLLALSFAVLVTVDTLRWYARFGWIDTAGRPVRVARADPARDWLVEHREVRYIEGDYWDVYRLAFLSGRSLRGKPYPVYPNRFPEWPRESRAVLVAQA